MTDHKRLTFLQREEHRLEALFVQAVYREDAGVMARIRTEYNIVFQELINLCRRLGIIGGN